MFNDTTQSMLGSCAESDIAVKVLTRVIGHYPTQNMLLIDLGWTGCSAQGAEFGYGVLAGHSNLRVVQLKQEAVSNAIILLPRLKIDASRGATGGLQWSRGRSRHLIMRR